jgi:hypothetical protein
MQRIAKKMEMPDARAAVKYPWHTMEVGESFFVKGARAKTFGQYRNATHMYAPKRWEARGEPEGLRIWRVK